MERVFIHRFLKVVWNFHPGTWALLFIEAISSFNGPEIFSMAAAQKQQDVKVVVVVAQLQHVVGLN